MKEMPNLKEFVTDLNKNGKLEELLTPKTILETKKFKQAIKFIEAELKAIEKLKTNFEVQKYLIKNHI